MIDNTELKAKAMLAQGMKPRAVAEKLEIGYPTVIKYRKQLREEAEEAKISMVASVDPIALEVIVGEIEKDASIKLDTDPIIEGARGLAKLQPKFATAMEKLLDRASDLADDEDLTPNGLLTLSKAVGTLYADVYNNKGTQVQVNNTTNNVSGDKMSTFAESQR